jgi:RHS repeat-associated protein
MVCDLDRLRHLKTGNPGFPTPRPTEAHHGSHKTGGCRLTTDLFHMTSDHLSSASLMMDASGATVSSQRYLPFGEVRHIDGLTDITQTDLGYTGQRNYAYINLLDYRARWYSSYLNRWTQPDSIIPDLTDPQSWNRYSYVNNNPVKFNDPTGHLPDSGDGWAIGDDLDDEDDDDDPVRVVCTDWDCVFKLMFYADLHKTSAEIVGPATEVFSEDPALLNWQQELVELAMADPRYGTEYFNFSKSKGLTFGEFGGPWYDQAKNPGTWIARAANVSANVQVSESGKVGIHYTLDDTLDLIPDWSDQRRNESGYNAVVFVLGAVYHGIFRATPLPITASWSTVVSP